MATREEFLKRNENAVIRNRENLERYRMEIEKEKEERGFLLHHRLWSDLNIQSLPRFIRVLKRVSLSIGMWTTLHYLAKAFWKRRAPQVYYSLNDSQKIAMAEKVCSTVHGISVSLWALKICLVDGVFQSNRTLEWYPLHGDELYSLSLGYEIYDLFTMYHQGTSAREMWAHHLALISCYLLEMWFRKVYSVTTTMMTTELTVLPANIHWYLKVFNKTNSSFYEMNKLFRLFLFLTLRVFAGPFVLYGITIKQRKQYSFQHWFLKGIVYCFPIFLSYLNWNWTFKLVKIYMAQKRKRNLLSQ